MSVYRTTTVSAKGQVVLPKATRAEMGWESGTKLRVQRTPDGVLLSPIHGFPVTTITDAFGCLSYKGDAKTIKEMDVAPMEDARSRT
ncbi:MAG: AbrB/MazE/SpoVT family DNA-binding domain-containing protein [Rhodobacterales bacterium]